MRDGKVDGSTSGFLLSQEHFGSISVITPNPKKLKGGGGQVAYLQGHGPRRAPRRLRRKCAMVGAHVRTRMTPGDGGVEGLWAYNGISGFLVQTEKCLDGRRRARLRRSAAIVGAASNFFLYISFLDCSALPAFWFVQQMWGCWSFGVGIPCRLLLLKS